MLPDTQNILPRTIKYPRVEFSQTTVYFHTVEINFTPVKRNVKNIMDQNLGFKPADINDRFSTTKYYNKDSCN